VFTFSLPLSMQNFTIRPVLWDYQKNQSETYSIKIAVTVDRKVTYILAGYKVHVTQWDDKKKAVIKHSNANLINVSIRRQIAELEKKIIDQSLGGKQITKHVILDTKDKSLNYFTYAKDVRYHHTELERLKNFAGQNLMISDIDVQFLRKFEQHEKKRNMSPNTIHQSFKYFSRIMNQARKEKIIKENPFDEFTKPKFKQTDRIYLVESELTLLKEMLNKPMHISVKITLTYFLLGCYSGLRQSDWQKFDQKNIENGYIKLRAKKNNEHVVIPIGKSLEMILDRMKDLPKAYSLQKSNDALKVIATICGIDKNLTSHVGRHTFGYQCASNGLPESTTAKLMGISAKTVKVYYHLSGENIKIQAAPLMMI
jgi:integrase/recombinase XerD